MHPIRIIPPPSDNPTILRPLPFSRTYIYANFPPPSCHVTEWRARPDKGNSITCDNDYDCADARHYFIISRITHGHEAKLWPALQTPTIYGVLVINNLWYEGVKDAEFSSTPLE